MSALIFNQLCTIKITVVSKQTMCIIFIFHLRQNIPFINLLNFEAPGFFINYIFACFAC